MSPPHTAASSMATPSGRLQRQPRKANCPDSVFWVMKTSSTMRIKNPKVRDVHTLAVRVNFTADSGGPGSVLSAGEVVEGSFGLSGDSYGSLLMVPFSPFPARKEPTQARKGGNPAPRAQPTRCGPAPDDSVGWYEHAATARAGRGGVALGAYVFAVTACGSANPLGVVSVDMKSIVVGSADFPESKIIAEIYAQALQTNGFNVGRQLGIGSRETYIPAVKDHSIDLMPEYIGNLLQYFEPDATVTMLDAVELALYKRLPGDLSILTPSPAADTDTVTVTAETAPKWNLKTIADLAEHSPEVKFAAPSEFQSRPEGLVGLSAAIRARHQPEQLRRDQRRRRCGRRCAHWWTEPSPPPTSSARRRPSRKTIWWCSTIRSTTSWPATLCRW